MVCLDLSTVFDTVNHKMLLNILENCFGRLEETLSWIISYLENRNFSVQIDQHISKVITNNFSIPQDSIPGVILLFNCYASILTEIIPGCKENFLSGYVGDHATVNFFNPNNICIKQKNRKRHKKN